MLSSIKSTYLRVVSGVTTILVDTRKRGRIDAATDFLLFVDPARKVYPNRENKHNIYGVIDHRSRNNNQDVGNGNKN